MKPERPIKGGYILISLGLVALSAGASLTVDYERITKTKKHIVLTGIKVADTIMPDITVKPIYGNGTITFEDVYGYDIVVSSNNSVSVSEHVIPSGGAKLYKHMLSHNTAGYRVYIISTKSTQQELKAENVINAWFGIGGSQTTERVLTRIYAGSGGAFQNIDFAKLEVGESSSFDTFTIDMNSNEFTDTVTEL